MEIGSIEFELRKEMKRLADAEDWSAVGLESRRAAAIGKLADRIADMESRRSRLSDRVGMDSSRLRDGVMALVADAGKGAMEYWGCLGAQCSSCPAMVDGETPAERYGVMTCPAAQAADIMCRVDALFAKGVRNVDGQ